MVKFSKFDFNTIQKKVIRDNYIAPRFYYVSKTEEQKPNQTLGFSYSNGNFIKKHIELNIKSSQPPKNQKPVVQPAQNVFHWVNVKPAFAFVTVLVFIFMIFQTILYATSAQNTGKQILGDATSAYSNLNSAKQSLGSSDFNKAALLFGVAQEQVKNAQDKLSQFSFLTKIYPQAESADYLLKGAYGLAEAGKKLSEAISILKEIQINSSGIKTLDFSGKLSENLKVMNEVLVLFKQAEQDFSKVSGIPSEYNDTLESGMSQISKTIPLLENIIKLEDLYLSVFGDSNRTYLLVFQNYDEARATGGFIGTYGVLRVGNGLIKKLEIKSVYDLDGSIFDQIAAPGPLQPAVAKWGLRDANWFADFPLTARKLLYFFERGQETADGVISFTPKLFSDLLSLVGPITMEKYGVTLTAENFQKIAQFQTSVAFDPVLNEPKKFLADFAPVLMDKLGELKDDQWLKVLELFNDNLTQKQVLLYSKNTDTQNKLFLAGWTGSILSSEFDYLMLVNSNVGGTKTDLNMKRSANLESEILSDGSVLNKLTIDQTNSSETFNKNYLRILVPFGSILLSATGFDSGPFFASSHIRFTTDPDLSAWDKGVLRANNVFERVESGKTEFAGWITTQSGQSRTLTLNYILPNKLNPDFLSGKVTYSLLLQKQPALVPIKFKSFVKSDNLNVFWMGSGVNLLDSKAMFESDTEQDDFIGVIFEKK